VAGRSVALLRGINLTAPGTRIAMADLRALFEDLGHTDVRTLLNSGNVVFTPGRRTAGDEGAGIAKAIGTKLGVRTSVIVLGAAEVARAVDEEPFGRSGIEPARRLVVALRDPKAKSRMKDVLAKDWSPEEIVAGRRVVYLCCPGGLHQSRAWNAVNKVLGDDGTARNLATMTKLRALVEET